MLTRRDALRKVLTSIGQCTTPSHILPHGETAVTRHASHLSSTRRCSCIIHKPSIAVGAQRWRSLHDSHSAKERGGDLNEASAVSSDAARKEVPDETLMWALQNAVSEVMRDARVSSFLKRVEPDNQDEDEEAHLSESTFHIAGPSSDLATGGSIFTASDVQEFDVIDTADVEDDAYDQVETSDTDQVAPLADFASIRDALLKRLRAIRSHDRISANTSGTSPSAAPIEDQQTYRSELAAQLSNASSVYERKQLKRRLYLATERGETARTPYAIWHSLFTLMTKMSPSGASYYAKALQTTTMPDGLSVKWVTNPLHTIREIFERTSCFMQVHHDSVKVDHLPETFTTYTLYGTETQREAAKRYIVESGQFTAVRSPDWHRDNADGGQRLSGSATASNGTTGPIRVASINRAQNDTAMDGRTSIDTKAIESIKATAIAEAAARTHWDRIRDTRPLKELLKAAYAGPALPALEFTRLIKALTQYHSPEERAADKAAKDYRMEDLLNIALVSALTQPRNLQATTREAINAAFAFMSKHRFFTSIRRIIAAHHQLAPESRVASTPVIDTSSFNYVLAACVKAEDQAMFLGVLHAMSRRGLSADAQTWIHFYELSQRCMPRQTRAVESSMAKLEVLEDESAFARTLGHTLPRKFAHQLDSCINGWGDPRALVDKFIHTERERFQEVDPFTQFCIREVFDILMDRAMWNVAWYFLKRVDSEAVTPPLLLSCLHKVASGRSSEPARCIQILNKCEAMLDNDPVKMHDLYKRRPSPYEDLFRCAIDARRWNFLRVVWQHACSAGAVTWHMRHRMEQSLSSRDYKKPISALDSQRFWRANFAAFAMQPGPHTPAARQTRKQLLQQIHSGRKLSPVNTLVSDLRGAWALDRAVEVENIWHPNTSACTDGTLLSRLAPSYEIKMRPGAQVGRD